METSLAFYWALSLHERLIDLNLKLRWLLPLVNGLEAWQAGRLRLRTASFFTLSFWYDFNWKLLQLLFLVLFEHFLVEFLFHGHSPYNAPFEKLITWFVLFFNAGSMHNAAYVCHCSHWRGVWIFLPSKCSYSFLVVLEKLVLLSSYCFTACLSCRNLTFFLLILVFIGWEVECQLWFSLCQTRFIFNLHVHFVSMYSKLPDGRFFELLTQSLLFSLDVARLVCDRLRSWMSAVIFCISNTF